MLKAIQFRVQNYRNIEDSGWISIERVTSLVGRNESGKTALLKALHKFNPATPEQYNAQREFPRDRYTRDFKDGGDWPVCSIKFEISSALQHEVETILEGGNSPTYAICTRYYDGAINIILDPEIVLKAVTNKTIISALKSFAALARRLKPSESDQEEQLQSLRTKLADWASDWQERLKEYTDLRNPEGVAVLSELLKDSEKKSDPKTADMVESIQESVKPTLEDAKKISEIDQIKELIESNIPIFIYFENYGILDSAIYLPRFIDDLKKMPNDARVRTVNAMFKHVGLTAKDIDELGVEEARLARSQNQMPSDKVLEQDRQRKDARAIKLNSASLDITKRFNEWYGQRRHTIDYRVDGDYFRIWIADDRRPGVNIELEGRSKGFQWFFSFYLIFLVESEEGHKDAVLLLDEPGIHLHPTAQQELISFFESLAEKNQLIYTTHSPFLIDGEHLHRVRPVTEDDSGHSHVSTDEWPRDRETIFPLQAAAGYAIIRGLFQSRKNLLVEGMSDFYYLKALSQQCNNTGRVGLPDDIYITPCGGTKYVGHLASLFLGHSVRPVVLLDGDDAGRVRRAALLKELYSGYESSIIMLNDVLDRSDSDVEIEDILGEETIMQAVKDTIQKPLRLNEKDRDAGSLPDQIKAAAARHSIAMPEGWKATVAIQLVSAWAKDKIVLSDGILDASSKLFNEIKNRFDG